MLTTSGPARQIASDTDIAEGLDALCRMDPALAAIRPSAGHVPLRRSEPGFHSLASIIVAQQVTTASARAIFARLQSLAEPVTAQALLASEEAVLREVGLSHAKIRALRSAAAAVIEGLDLSELCRVEAEDAIARLVAIPGVGRWTAEMYLLVAAGHPDVFPARDLALQIAAGHALGLSSRPGEKALAALAESWRPWRSVASRLLWAYYHAVKARETAPS